jgi:hypothetical protein
VCLTTVSHRCVMTDLDNISFVVNIVVVVVLVEDSAKKM